MKEEGWEEVTDAYVSGMGMTPTGRRYLKIAWATANKGWGEMAFWLDKGDIGQSNGVQIDAETLPKEFVKRVLGRIVDMASLIG